MTSSPQFYKMKLFNKILFSLLIILSAISCIKEDEPVSADLQVGDTIPDFIVQMNDGTSVSGAQLRKGISVIMFFHTGCPDCQKTLPSVQQIYQEYGDNVCFALISREQGNDEIAPYWESLGYTLPYSAQTDRNVYHLFASSRVPRVYVCKDGIIRYMYDDDPVPSYSDLNGNLNSL